jgi:hypothetical protein
MFSPIRSADRRRPRFVPAFDVLAGRVLPSDLMGGGAPPEATPLQAAPLEWRDYCGPIYAGGDGDTAKVDPRIDPVLLPATTI